MYRIIMLYYDVMYNKTSKPVLLCIIIKRDSIAMIFSDFISFIFLLFYKGGTFIPSIQNNLLYFFKLITKGTHEIRAPSWALSIPLKNKIKKKQEKSR